jgi:hypothetical protein
MTDKPPSFTNGRFFPLIVGGAVVLSVAALFSMLAGIPWPPKGQVDRLELLMRVVDERVRLLETRQTRAETQIELQRYEHRQILRELRMPDRQDSDAPRPPDSP